MTPIQTSAVIIYHIENGQRETYDTDDPSTRGCESPTMICTFPISLPNSTFIANETQSSMIYDDEYLLKGNQLLDEGRYEEALAAFDAVITEDPTDQPII